MRILVVTNLYPPAAYGGYEALCGETTARLARDHDVLVLTTDRGGLESEAGVLRELDYLPPGTASALRAPLSAWSAARVTRRVLASFQPDLVFIWNGAAMPQVVIRIVACSGVPVAWSIHEHWFSRLYTMDQFARHLLPGDRGLRALWGLLVKAVNRLPPLRLEFERPTPGGVSWVSEFLRKSVPAPPSVEPTVERVIPSAVPDVELWSGLERRPDPTPMILFVGRIEEQKGPDVAYRALAELRARHGVEARLVLAGRHEPAMSQRLESLASELGIADCVELAGPLPPGAVGGLLARASALVMPVNWQEPAGLVPIEAALARVPVVASYSGGMPERLLPDEHALYFPIGDASACADALARTLAEKDVTAERVERARERALEFGFDGYMQRTHDFLDATLAGPQRSTQAAAPRQPDSASLTD
jgi:glycosyltransferase involved in cell wall biosynthesis